MNTFVSGVVEGFYGRPWTSVQRNELFKRLQKFELNTFLYAPKDDIKHRQLWRVLYSSEEIQQLKLLIENCKKHKVMFVYALSPGLDIEFSNSAEINLIKRKMDQLINIGCSSFALLFDDIDPELSDNDKKHFGSPAAAQVSISNKLFEYTNKPHLFLFCPTEYCMRQTKKSSVVESEYLQIIGKGLMDGIDILWTGPKVVSNYISTESIKEVTVVLRRPPVIWDNIHANDYDLKRVFLGPFSGRPVELSGLIRGILTNPNCEFEANFVAIHTMAQWIRCGKDNSDNSDYKPADALKNALEDWLKLLYESAQNQDEIQNLTEKDLADTVVNKLSLVPESRLSIDDLTIITHLFYLPYEHGSTAVWVLDAIHWLKMNSHIVEEKEESHLLVKEWHSKADELLAKLTKIRNILDEFLNIPNRNVMYDIYGYNRNIQYLCGTISTYIKWMSRDPKFNTTLMDNSKDHEPWIHRGGLSSELERMLPFCGGKDLHPNKVQFGSVQSQLDNPISANQNDPSFYFIRSYNEIEDKESLYNFIFRSFCKTQLISPALDEDHLLNNLPGDVFVGDWLKVTPDTCHLLLNEDDVIKGYVIGTCDVELLRNYSQTVFNEDMISKYDKFFSESDKENDEQLSDKCAFKKLYNSYFMKDTLDCKALTDTGLITLICQERNVKLCNQLIKTVCRHMKTKNTDLKKLILKVCYCNTDQWKLLELCGFRELNYKSTSSDNVGDENNQKNDAASVFYASLSL